MGRFEIKFSKHAERQLKERNIAPDLVRETLENPEQIVTAGKIEKLPSEFTTDRAGTFY